MATEQPVYEYAVQYPDQLVFDPSWRCVADVLASFNSGAYCTPEGQVTGVLVRALLGTMAWEVVS